MDKNFDEWNECKKNRDKNDIDIYFYEREIWWCAIGVNVGFEQDGKGERFARPVLIIRKFSKNVFLGVPLTTMQMRMKRISRIALKIFSAISRLIGIFMPILSFTTPIPSATMRNKIVPVIQPRITAATIRSMSGLSEFCDILFCFTRQIFSNC